MHDMSLERTSLDESSVHSEPSSRRARGLRATRRCGSNLLFSDSSTDDRRSRRHRLSEQSAYRNVVELPEPLRRAAAEVGLASDLSQLVAQRDAASLMDSTSAGWRERIEIRRIWRSRTATSPHGVDFRSVFKLLGSSDAGPKEQNTSLDLVAPSPRRERSSSVQVGDVASATIICMCSKSVPSATISATTQLPGNWQTCAWVSPAIPTGEPEYNVSPAEASRSLDKQRCAVCGKIP